MRRFDVFKDGRLLLKGQTMTAAVHRRIDQAVAAAEHEVSIRAVTVAPPPIHELRPARRLLLLAGDVQAALGTRPEYTLVASADLEFRHLYTEEWFAQAKKHGPVRFWCDCIPSPLGTPPEVAFGWMDELKIPRSLQAGLFVGQCESADQFSRGYVAGARVMVGKVDALEPDQRDRLRSGEVHITNENYRNKTPDEVPNWDFCNAGVDGNCGAVYSSDREGAVYTSVKSQLARGWMNLLNDSWYCVGFQDEDWGLLS